MYFSNPPRTMENVSTVLMHLSCLNRYICQEMTMIGYAMSRGYRLFLISGASLM